MTDQQLPGTINRYSPLGFYHLAEDFYRAGVASAPLGRDQDRRFHYDLVLYHLHVHSLELALKAYLLAVGVSVDDLKSEYSHGLRKLLNRATELRLKVPETERGAQAVEWLDELSKLQTFRYFEGGALRLPSLPEARELNERILAAVKPQCLASTLQR